jgi:hypothetical protein
MTRPTETARIAVLDIGKTNLKLLMASEDGWPLETLSIPNAANTSGPTLPMILPDWRRIGFSALSLRCRDAITSAR